MTIRPVKPRPELVLVEWLDSTRTPGWVRPDNVSPTAGRCCTVGWLLYEDKDVLSLAGSLAFEHDGSLSEVDGQMSIPKVAIITRRKLAKNEPPSQRRSA